MTSIILHNNAWFYLLMVTLVIILIKISVYFLGTTFYWTFRHFVFISPRSIRGTRHAKGFYLKLMNNIFSLLLLFAVAIDVFFICTYKKDKGSVIVAGVSGKQAVVANVAIKDEKPKVSRAVELDFYPEIESIAAINNNTEPITPGKIKSTNKKDKLVKPNTNSSTKELSLGKMYAIFQAVSIEKRKYENKSNSIQIVKSNKSNVENAFDVAKIFQQYGYSIAGRELTSSKVSGYKIDVSGTVIKVTVGNF